jgi:hypothetical protein
MTLLRLLPLLLLAWLPRPAAAADLLGVYGAWVSEREECGRVFANDRGRVAFIDEGRGAAPGFILGRDGIANAQFACEVREYTVRGDTLTFTGRCRAERRTRRTRFVMRSEEGRVSLEVDRARVPLKRCAPEGLKELAAIREERARFERERASAQDRARGLWAAEPGACERAFVRDERGVYRVAPGPEGASGVIITPSRFVTRGSVCTAQQAVSDLETGRSFQANYLCQAEGREFATSEKVAILEPDVIERTPAARTPQPQTLVRCTPQGWEAALGE